MGPYGPWSRKSETTIATRRPILNMVLSKPYRVYQIEFLLLSLIWCFWTWYTPFLLIPRHSVIKLPFSYVSWISFLGADVPRVYEIYMMDMCDRPIYIGFLGYNPLMSSTYNRRETERSICRYLNILSYNWCIYGDSWLFIYIWLSTWLHNSCDVLKGLSSGSDILFLQSVRSSKYTPDGAGIAFISELRSIDTLLGRVTW